MLYYKILKYLTFLKQKIKNSQLFKDKNKTNKDKRFINKRHGGFKSTHYWSNFI